MSDFGTSTSTAFEAGFDDGTEGVPYQRFKSAWGPVKRAEYAAGFAEGEERVLNFNQFGDPEWFED